jgi:Protein of unknown function (DUF3891)
MILRPLEPKESKALRDSDSPGNQAFLPAWQIVERLQKQKYEGCWMITQPSHAALAGELAAKLAGPQVPELSPDLIRAIAMHDAGWGMLDAQAVAHSRSSNRHRTPPKSFLQTTVAEFVDAWTQSIHTVQSISPAGGYIVSRHFWRLAEHRMATPGDSEGDRQKLEHFLEQEATRQRKLAAKQTRSVEDLELLTELLQFCDLLSLYLCVGARDQVEFPEHFGAKVRLKISAEGYRLDPPLIESGAKFTVAALRHPATKEESGREIEVKIG